jgi:hypothetical protein
LETFVDSSVLLDLFTEDPGWLIWSQEQLTKAAQRGAIILNAIVLAEIAPRFPRIETLRSALPSMAIVEEIPPSGAFLAGHAHAHYRRAGGTREAVRDEPAAAHARPTPHRRLYTWRHAHRSLKPSVDASSREQAPLGKPTRGLEPRTPSLPWQKLQDARSLGWAPFLAPMLGIPGARLTDKAGQPRAKESTNLR